MFCPKCGTKALDGAEFCQKCGAKLHTADASPRSAAQSSASTPGAQTTVKKKKSKRLLFAVLGIAAVLAVILIVVGMSGGEIDYIATVKAHKPFAISQDLPYTYAEVFEKYLDDPIWHTASMDEKAKKATVKVDGTLKGTEYGFVVSIEVSPNPDDPNGSLIVPQTVMFDGTESHSQDDAVEFLYLMFAAYDEGYEDLSELLSDAEAPEGEAPAAIPGSEASVPHSDIPPSSLCYDDRLAVAAQLGRSSSELMASLGAPLPESTVDVSLYSGYGYECYAYDGITFIMNPSWGKVETIIALPDKLSLYGETLDKNRDELVALLGKPLYEGEMAGEGGYYINYGVADDAYGIYYDLSIELLSPEEDAFVINVRTWEGPAPEDPEYNGSWQQGAGDAGYTQVDLQTLFDELDANALRANQTYNGTKVQFTGYLGTVDSDGKYISVDASPNDLSFDSISCYFTDPSQLNVVLEKGRGDEVTICGTITEVGEFLGYKMDIESVR